MAAKRVILLDNPFKLIERSCGPQLLDWLDGRVDVVAHNVGRDLDLKQLPDADFLVTLGGDGTILGAVRALGSRQMPIIGVNMGKLGFLAEFSLEEFQEQFDRLISDAALLVRRVMLDCRLERVDGSVYETMAVNELAVIAGPPFRMIEVSVNVGGEHLALCAGDGLIVATPTGSTAYNLSAGGPILAAELEAAVITPLAAHSLSFRPIVLGFREPIILQCRDSRQSSSASSQDSQRSAVMAVDGHDHVPISPQDRVIITKAPAAFVLARNPMQSQYRVLNTKLNWGRLPNYAPNNKA